MDQHEYRWVFGPPLEQRDLAYLTTFLKETVDEIQESAERLGLAFVFEKELFRLQIETDEALHTQSETLVRQAIESARQVRERIRSTRSRHSQAWKTSR